MHTPYTLLACFLMVLIPIECNGQTVADALDLLGIETGKDRGHFEVNRENINETFTWNVDFDTLIVTTFYNKNYGADKEDITIESREFYFARKGELIQYIARTGAGRVFMRKWYHQGKKVREEDYNSFIMRGGRNDGNFLGENLDSAKFTAEFKYDKAGLLDSVVTWLRDSLQYAIKVDSIQRGQHLSSEIKMIGERIVSATSTHGLGCPSDNFFNYKGDHLQSIMSYCQANPKKKIAEILFDEQGMIIKRGGIIKSRSWWEYSYVFDSRGRRITRTESLRGDLTVITHRKFK